MLNQSRIFYVGMITTEHYGAAIGDKVFSGAGERKMSGISKALRSSGLRACILSIPTPGKKSKRTLLSKKVVVNESGVPSVFLPSSSSPTIRKIVGSFYLLLFACFKIKRCDDVILYNHAIEYLPALFAIKIRGIRIFMDIEDAPGEDESGWRRLLSRRTFDTIFKLTERRKIVVAEHVAEYLNLDEYTVIPGVSDHTEKLYRNTEKWTKLKGGGDLILHYGGTLIPGTGIDIFCRTIHELSDKADQIGRPVKFVITGSGEFEKIEQLKREVSEVSKIKVEILAGLSREGYEQTTRRSHGSFSLREPGSPMAMRTFPSKVIEITSKQVCLISTDGGDVSKLFSSSSANLVPYNSKDLASVILKMCNDPDKVENIAKAGAELSDKIFAPSSMSEKIVCLLQDRST